MTRIVPLESASQIRTGAASARVRRRMSASRAVFSARARSIAAQVRSPISVASAISAGVHSRGVVMESASAPTRRPCFASGMPSRLTTRSASTLSRQSSGTRGDVCTSVIAIGWPWP
ncbi:hypothetical protein BK022_12955 [Methylorubrum extorquens]|uniref:Uncharacterized protein n=1 Tax=Methylorubrum extorquens TaxID=408 RepID=A0A1S1P4Z9_METEX|nr:hypothetical protein BK022_12955 [Methylorubrum extorquens]